MEKWGYVFLAYGIVWTALVVYVLLLKARLRMAEAEKAMTLELEEPKNHE